MLEGIMKAMITLKELTIAFTVHPRTRQRLTAAKFSKQLASADHIKLIEPIGYHEMLQLTKNAKMVFTDSGGLQKEAFWLHTPCVTLRKTTEWIETIEFGANDLAGSNPKRIVEAARKIMDTRDVKVRLGKLKNPFGKGQAAEDIVGCILK
jgi:UDP-N-acetylglucosamine 2-epimerase